MDVQINHWETFAFTQLRIITNLVAKLCHDFQSNIMHASLAADRSLKPVQGPDNTCSQIHSPIKPEKHADEGVDSPYLAKPSNSAPASISGNQTLTSILHVTGAAVEHLPTLASSTKKSVE
jgi:hypothetical protein